MSRSPRVLIAGAVVVAVASGGGVAAQLRRSAPPVAVRVSVASTLLGLVTPGVPVILPPQGSLSLEDGRRGSLASLAPGVTRPIGSVAKTMTALVVAEAHPLAGPRDQGPTLTMTAADVALYRSTVAEDGSSLPVTDGERLTERDLLLALMLPSANNIAETLGAWIAGGHDEFVARLNARAAQLGMIGTHFADASGYDPATASTSGDLVKLGAAALANATVAAVAATRRATFPDGMVVENLDALLTTEPGWLGIKTGETPGAGGCLLFAVRRTVPGTEDAVTIVGAVLGQTDLAAAFDAARTAVRTAYGGYSAAVWSRHAPVINGEATSEWGDLSSVVIGSPHGATASALRPDDAVSLRVERRRPSAPVRSGTVVGTVHVVVDGSDVARWDVITAGPIHDAPVLWHIMHG